MTADRPTPTTEPPPLHAGSDAARVLLQLWEGRRIVHHAPPPGTPTEWVEDYVEIAAVVTAHLRLRAGYRVHLVADLGIGVIRTLHRALRSALPDIPIGLPYRVAADEIPSDEQARPHGKAAAINLTGPLEAATNVDLLVVLPPVAGLDARHVTIYLASGRQMLVLGADSWTSSLRLDDRDDLGDPPIDLAIAGGRYG